MKAVNAWLAQKWSALTEETGASMVEYALLVVLIAIVAIAAVSVTGNQTSDLYGDIVNGFP